MTLTNRKEVSLWLILWEQLVLGSIMGMNGRCTESDASSSRAQQEEVQSSEQGESTPVGTGPLLGGIFAVQGRLVLTGT